MPLSELLRLATGKPESGQQKSCPSNISSQAEDDLVELVWENGQIMMQSQSSRVTRSPALDSSPPNTNRACDADVGHAIATRIRKFGVQSVLDDVSPVVPSGELDLSLDGDTAPWLRSSRPIGDSLLQDYSSDILPEISGVTANGMCDQNSVVSVDKRSTRDQTVSNLHNGGNNSKASCSKAHLICSRPPLNCQTSDALGSGVSDIIGNNNVSNHMGFISRNTAQGRDIVNDSASIKMDRQNAGIPTNYSNLLNFSHFSRPATLVKPKLPTSVGTPASVSSGVEKMEVKEKGSAACASNLVKAMDVDRSNSMPKDVDFCVSSARQPAVKAPEESCPPARAENSLREPSTANSTKGVPDGERTVEPMVASSSVGSGNSSDRASCEQTHNSKRKFHDFEELECCNDDIETESVDVKKPTTARGTGSKRSRAAEVHNLSERRRRDRINEKMRALQELIPNCSKVDKASMLDEAIEYLKTLQLQVQIMSMGAGFCMPPMMFPTGVQHMHPAHVPLFSPLGVGMGMGMGMGFGMGMLDMKGGPPGCPIFPVPSMQVGNFPSPMSGPNNFLRVPAPNLHVYGHPSQGLPNSIPRAPTVPLTGQPPVTSAMGLSDTRNVSHTEVPGTSPTLHSGDPMKQKNSPSMFNSEAGSSMNHKSNQLQATSEVLHQSAEVQANQCATDAGGPTVLTSPTATNISKEAGSD